jgi:hypothetical protein
MSKQIAWGARVDRSFVDRVVLMCNNLHWNWDQAPSQLMSCIAFESGETFSPSIKNAAGSGATGLIQFMPDTATGLGTSVQALAAMDALEQLSWVERYFRPYAAKIAAAPGVPSMYMGILLPKYCSAPDSSILFTDGTVAYRQNAALDANNDGKITKAEAAAKVAAKLSKGLLPANVITI